LLRYRNGDSSLGVAFTLAGDGSSFASQQAGAHRNDSVQSAWSLLELPFQLARIARDSVNTKTLVTGGCGFIGSHIVARLVEEGDRVSVLDDLSTGRYENLPGSPRVTFHLGSVLDASAVARAAAGADRIIHLASVVGMRLASSRQSIAYQVSVEGTSTVLAATGNRPIVVFSSSSVYPDVHQREHHESDWLSLEAALVYDGGRPGYACGKLRLEQLAREERRKGRRVLIVRPFNVIGPGQVSAYGMVLPTFIENARAGWPLRVYDDGEQTRTFGDVTMFADCLLRLMDQDRAWVAQKNTFNIGSRESTTINQLAELVRKTTRAPVPIVHVPYEVVFPGRRDVRSRLPDTTRLETLLGPLEWPSVEDIVHRLSSASTPAIHYRSKAKVNQ
jgi:UDP-glucose 4-epimerase